jgi:hypothetical protein
LAPALRPATPNTGGGSPGGQRRRYSVISLFLWLLRIPVPVLILLYLFNII